MEELSLFLFNLSARIQCDDPKIMALYQHLHPRSISTQKQDGEYDVLARVLSHADTMFGEPVVILGDEVRPLPLANQNIGYVYELILQAMLQRVESHFLIHAGVVSRGGSGLLLAGDAFHGKTTLVLEMVRRGCSFLSDEMAAISRRDAQVHPYPRSLSIRPETLERMKLPLPATSFDWYGKKLVDIEDLFPGSMGEAVPMGAICILCDAGMFPETRGTTSRRLVHLWVDHCPADLAASLRKLKGVADLQLHDRRDHVLVTMTAGDPTRVMAQAGSLCSRLGMEVLGISNQMVHKPRFDAPARLEAISRSQAALFLLQRLMGGRKALLQGTPGRRPAHLFIELMYLIREARCYTLNVGPLEQMADLLDEINP